MSVREYKPTGIEITQKEDYNGYHREYYRCRGRFKRKKKEGEKP